MRKEGAVGICHRSPPVTGAISVAAATDVASIPAEKNRIHRLTILETYVTHGSNETKTNTATLLTNNDVVFCHSICGIE